MACQFYNNGGLGSCAGCCHFNKSLSLNVTGSTLNVAIGPQVLKNRERICVAIVQNIPQNITQNTKVSIAITGTAPITIPVMTKCGNFVYADQLRTRKVLHLIIGTDVPVFILNDTRDICCTDHAFPTISTSTTTAVSAALEEVVETPVTKAQSSKGGSK